MSEKEKRNWMRLLRAAISRRTTCTWKPNVWKNTGSGCMYLLWDIVQTVSAKQQSGWRNKEVLDAISVR